jgi:hypothetical protein
MKLLTADNDSLMDVKSLRQNGNELIDVKTFLFLLTILFRRGSK